MPPIHLTPFLSFSSRLLVPESLWDGCAGSTTLDKDLWTRIPKEPKRRRQQ